MKTDSEIAERLRMAASDLNHWLSVAKTAGLHVQLTAAQDPELRISQVYVARPVPPSEVVGPALLAWAPAS